MRRPQGANPAPIGSLENQKTGAGLHQCGHFYLAESGHFYLGITILLRSLGRYGELLRATVFRFIRILGGYFALTARLDDRDSVASGPVSVSLRDSGIIGATPISRHESR